MASNLNVQIFQWIHAGAGSLVVGLASAGSMHRIAGRFNPLHAKRVQFAGRLTGRIVRTKSHGARKR